VSRHRHSVPLATAFQWFLLQGALAILLVGVVLPIGLILIFLTIRGNSPVEAVRHGELLLAGGNAVFMGCICLVSSRTDNAMAVGTVSLMAMGGLVVPSYAAWAYVSVATLAHDHYSRAAVLVISVVMFVMCVNVAWFLVRLAYRPAEA
jgi:hypothetical protein